MKKMEFAERVLLLLLFSFSLADNTGDYPSFASWSKQHDKVYPSLKEKLTREKVFYDNVKTIHKLNELYKQSNVTFGVNQFADLSQEEFKSHILMTSRSPPILPKERYITFPSLGRDPSPPDTFDWRNKGVVTPIKDQGSAGTCWAFSTVENIEGQWVMAGNNLTSLSPEQLVDCDDNYDPNNLHMDCGVFGGWPYLAYDYIKNEGGIEKESDYPYCSGKGTCFPCVPSGWNKTRCGPPPLYCNDTFSCKNRLDKDKFVPGLKVKSWIAVNKDEVEMQTTLVKQGPLSVLMNAVLLQFYHSGVWDPFLKCDSSSLDHAVLLVGYGTDKGLFGEKPYWLIKNSWGTKWGMDGYFKLIRGKGKCGIDQQVTSAVLE